MLLNAKMDSQVRNRLSRWGNGLQYVQDLELVIAQKSEF